MASYKQQEISMSHSFKFVMATVAVAMQLMSSAAFADTADSSEANIQISGNVPVIFSLTVRGLPGDLDLTPGVIVNDRTLGIFHFKYNIDIASLLLTSDSATGAPMNGATAYNASVPFTFKFGVCATVADAVGEVDMTLAAGTSADMKEAAGAQPSGLGYGIEEDCELTASWGGEAVTPGQIPLSGKYSETLTLTMVSI